MKTFAFSMAAALAWAAACQPGARIEHQPAAQPQRAEDSPSPPPATAQTNSKHESPAAEPAFLFCYSPSLNSAALLLYGTTFSSEEREFAQSCGRDGNRFFTQRFAYCWVTLSPIPRMNRGVWDNERVEHRCYATSELCTSERRSMIDYWSLEGTPIPLIGECVATVPSSPFLRFTMGLDHGSIER